MLLVRADGNAKIGAGHLMRCLTIIESYVQLVGTKEDILFVCADEMSAAVVRERGFFAQILGTDYRNMESELPLWRAMLSSGGGFGEKNALQIDSGKVGRCLTFLVDSYYVTEEYLRGLQAFGSVVLLDDMQQRAFPVDAVVNYNVFAREEIYGNLYRNSSTRLYIGGEYVPVRPEFLRVSNKVSKEVENVLITTGGGDVDNIAGAILQAVYNSFVQYHLVIGRFNPHREELERLAEKCKNVHLHMDVKDMAELMGRCDLAITAGGTTIYELSAIGIPFVCFSYAENQEALTEYLGERGIAYFAGAYHKEPGKVLERMRLVVTKLYEDFEERRNCFRRERDLIDGKGAERLAQLLVELQSKT